MTELGPHGALDDETFDSARDLDEIVLANIRRSNERLVELLKGFQASLESGSINVETRRAILAKATSFATLLGEQRECLNAVCAMLEAVWSLMAEQRIAHRAELDRLIHEPPNNVVILRSAEAEPVLGDRASGRE